MRRGRRRLSKPVESFTGDRNREHDHPTRGVVLPVAVLSETGWGASIDADESRGHGAGRDRTRRTHRQVIDTRAPRPLRCVWIFNLLLRQRVRWDYPPVNSGPLAQGSVRYGLEHLDSVTVGFRQSHGVAVVAAGCSPGATGSPGKFSGVNTRRMTFTVMLVMSVVAAMPGCSTPGGSSLAATSGAPATSSRSSPVILVGTGVGPGSVIGSLFGSLLIGMINNGLILAGLGVSSGRSSSASSSSSRSSWRGRNDG